MVILIIDIAVSLKPDSAFVSGPCALIEGTPEPQGGKQVVFNVHNIEEKGEMNCTCSYSNDYAKYSTNKMAEMALAAFPLIVTMNSGFGYAIGEIPAGHYATSPSRKNQTDVPVQLRNRCESAMRGLVYGSHIERSVTSFRLT